jgi:hypothetical protein
MPPYAPPYSVSGASGAVARDSDFGSIGPLAFPKVAALYEFGLLAYAPDFEAEGNEFNPQADDAAR